MSVPAAAPAHLVAPPTLRDPLAEALRAAGVELVAHPAVPVLAATVGEPPLDSTDAWLRDSRPHLLAGLDAREVRLGPFVVPGVTACRRCLAADRLVGEADTTAADARSQPPAPSQVVLAAGWLAEDLRRWHRGEPPTTWSATVRLDARLQVRRRARLRHPHCGCSWGCGVGLPGGPGPMHSHGAAGYASGPTVRTGRTTW